MKYSGRTFSIGFATITTLITLNDLIATFSTRLNDFKVFCFVGGVLIEYHCGVKISVCFCDLKNDYCAKVEGRRPSVMIEEAFSSSILKCRGRILMFSSLPSSEYPSKSVVESGNSIAREIQQTVTYDRGSIQLV